MATTSISQSPQLSLWNDIRVPLEYHEHYLKTKHCINCREPLRHHLHALNHWKKYHRIRPEISVLPKKPSQKFYIYTSGIGWGDPVPRRIYREARKGHIPTAHTNNGNRKIISKNS